MAANGLTVRWRAWRASKAPVLYFALRLGLLMALFYALALLPGSDRIVESYLKATASLSGVVLNWVGQDCRVSDSTIRSARFAISVRRGCDALEASWFFSAAVLSFPALSARKYPGILAGIIVLQLLNLLRIVSLYFTGFRFPRHFNIVHVEIWPAAFIVVTIALWFWCIGWARRHDEPAP